MKGEKRTAKTPRAPKKTGTGSRGGAEARRAMKGGRVAKKPFGSKEGLGLEFKRAADRLPVNFFDTVCAFLNMEGGLIVLGVEDDGTVSGVVEDAIERIKADICP